MERIHVTSSNLRSVGYDPETRVLEIEFNSGDIYQYYNVPQKEYVGLMNAGSHGKYFQANIKNAYQCRKVG